MPISQFSAIQPLFVQCHPAHARESYTKAILFIQHKSLIIHNLIRNNSRASFLTALALPGIMRAISFSGLLTMKFMEWKYIHFGHLPVDYTVGELQMRLSMAEEIEQYLKNNPALQSKAGLLLYPQISEKNIRRMRLKRMYSLEWQLRYLRAFDVIMRHLFRKAGFDDTLQRLRFYAHIYYRGSLLKQGKANDSALDLTSASTKNWEADCAVQFYLYETGYGLR
ncbi:hypothetical protein [Rhodoflexus caldus]|uniref:hypothetical protein n=1 Tax=Rhodoflexus caldus TaxID=2891236 RepID=UPI00202A6892|nr:hypothetical protein [Rhodoflexus caldus]